MAKYSRYGSFFLANEADIETVIKAKPINRKRHDFVNDTDPENFADNIDDTLPEDDLAPEGFPMGDISDIPDDPSDEIEQFPTDGEEDMELDGEEGLPEFPTDMPEDLDNEIGDFPADEPSGEEPPIEDFPDDSEGDSNADNIPDDSTTASSDIISDGNKFLDDFKKKFGDKIPTPDEIIEDLRKKVYGENPPDATQNNINNSEIPDFPTDSMGDATTTNIDTNIQNTGVEPFPGDANNIQQPTPDFNQQPIDNTMPPAPDMNMGAAPAMPEAPGMEPFPGEAPTPDMTAPDAGGVITPDTGAPTGMDTTGTADFAAGTDTGMPPMPGGEMGDMGATGGMAPQQPPGPGIGYDSMRKYNLYKEYNRLLDAIGNYINKLESLMFDEPHQNLIVKTVIDKLNEVKKLCYDFITMKYEASSYTQSYVFFEELTVSIQVIFTLLMTISSYNTDEDDNKKKKTTKKDKPKK